MNKRYYFIFIALAGSIIFSTFLYNINQREIKYSDLDANLTEIVSRLAFNVSYPLWNLNVQEIKNTILHETEHSEIGLVKVFNQRGELVAQHAGTNAKVIENNNSLECLNCYNVLERPIKYQTKEIGKIVLLGTDETVKEELNEIALYSLILDITLTALMGISMLLIYENKKKQNYLVQSNKLLETSNKSMEVILSTTHDGVIVQNSKGDTLLANRNAEILLGLSRKQLLGKEKLPKNWKLVKEDYSKLESKNHPATISLRTKKPVNNTIIGIHKDKDNITWTRVNTAILQVENQEFNIITTYSDITDIKKQELDIQKFKLAVEAATEQIIITDAEGIVLFANEALTTITGYDVKNIIGKKVATNKYWGGLMDDEYYQNMWDTIKNKKIPFKGEIRNRRKSGEEYTSLINISPVINSSKEIEYFVSIERDITVYKDIERMKNELDSFFTISVDMLCIANTEGFFERVNDAFSTTLGWEKSELLNKSFFEIVLEEDLKKTKEEISRLEKGNPTIHFENRFKCKDGSVRWLRWNAIPLDNKKIYAIARDVTKEKEIDMMKSEFISLASHQLRTPLTSIRWNAEILEDNSLGKLNKEQKDRLNKIVVSNASMIDLVNTLLNISRIESGRLVIEPRKVKIDDLLEDIKLQVEVLVKEKKQKLTIVNNSKVNEVLLDQKLFENAVINLISNASKYSDMNEEIILETTDHGENIIFSVKDNGMGIPKEQQEKIFTKFYRAENTKDIDTDGTGLGLYLVKIIVESSGGQVWFESEENKGTKFSISFPKEGMIEQRGEVTLS